VLRCSSAPREPWKPACSVYTCAAARPDNNAFTPSSSFEDVFRTDPRSSMSKPSRFLLCAFFFTLALSPSLIAFAQAPVPSNPEIDRRVVRCARLVARERLLPRCSREDAS
jgi:hypothetical protein